MFNSLRARLLLWYTAILALVIAAFATTVCLLAWRTRVQSLDEVLHSHAEELAHSIQPTIGGTFDFELPPTPDAGTDAVTPYYALWNASGERIDSPNPDVDVPRPAGPGAWTREGRREVAILATADTMVLVGQSLADVWAELVSLAATIGIVGFGAMALSLAGGWWLVGRALEPVDRISQTARAMVGGDFDARIAIDSVETELGQVARALNDAFDRLNASIERQRRFTADASHELRTPLATVSTEVQWALNRSRTPDEYRHSLEACQRAAVRMNSVVERLLALARADAKLEHRTHDIRLHELVTEVARDLAPLTRQRNLVVSLELEPLAVTGDLDRLRDAITNVLANAVRYNVEGGSVAVTLARRDGDAVLTVRDSGIGIGAPDLPRIFEPFFRADPARSRDAGGAGLGLAVSRAIIERHGGRIEAQSVDGEGSAFVMRLPGASPIAAAPSAAGATVADG